MKLDELTAALARLRHRADIKSVWLNHWHDDGFPTFWLSPDVLALLKATDLPNCDCVREIVLPFRTVCLSFLDDGTNRLMMVSSWGHLDGSHKYDLDDGVRCLDFGDTRESASFFVMDGDDGAAIGFRIFDTDKFEAMFQRVQAPQGVCAIVLNAMALISSRPDECVAKGSLNRKRLDISSAVPLQWAPVRRWIVGRTIGLPSQGGDSSGGGPSWHLHSRFLVRGHWRLQACGQDRSERRLRWILPFWKGPRTADEALTRTYAVLGGSPRHVP